MTATETQIARQRNTQTLANLHSALRCAAVGLHNVKETYTDISIQVRVEGLIQKINDQLAVMINMLRICDSPYKEQCTLPPPPPTSTTTTASTTIAEAALESRPATKAYTKASAEHSTKSSANAAAEAISVYQPKLSTDTLTGGETADATLIPTQVGEGGYNRRRH